MTINKDDVLAKPEETSAEALLTMPNERDEDSTSTTAPSSESVVHYEKEGTNLGDSTTDVSVGTVDTPQDEGNPPQINYVVPLPAPHEENMTQIDISAESVENERSENDDTGEGETAAERGIRNHNYKASCTVCSKTLNHKSIVRHIKMVHGIDGKGKDYSVPLNEVPRSGNGEQPGAENHAVERNSSAPSNSNNSTPSVEENSTENLEDGINERENAIEEEPESETTEEVGTFVVTVPRSRHFEEKVICAKKEELQKFQRFGAFEVTRSENTRDELGSN